MRHLTDRGQRALHAAPRHQLREVHAGCCHVREVRFRGAAVGLKHDPDDALTNLSSLERAELHHGAEQAQAAHEREWPAGPDLSQTAQFGHHGGAHVQPQNQEFDFEKIYAVECFVAPSRPPGDS